MPTCFVNLQNSLHTPPPPILSVDNAGLASMKMVADTFLRARKSQGEGKIDQLLLLHARNSQ